MPRNRNIVSEFLEKFSHQATKATGTSVAFVVALLIIVVWAITGPLFKYSDTWQLVINTGTTIVTFLMVFLIQNTQNRDAKAIHLKLDELIKGVKGARTGLVNLEQLSDSDLEKLQHEFERLHKSVSHLEEKQEDPEEEASASLREAKTKT